MSDYDGGALQFDPSDKVIHRQVITGSVSRMAQAEPGKIQEIAASQIELLATYYDLAIQQAQRSFVWALVAAGAGFFFFLAAVAFVLFNQAQNVSVISLISGALIEVIAGINFYLYGKTTSQLSEFRERLDQTQRFLLANSVCESLSGETQQNTRVELVRKIASITPPTIQADGDGAA